MQPDFRFLKIKYISKVSHEFTRIRTIIVILLYFLLTLKMFFRTLFTEIETETTIAEIKNMNFQYYLCPPKSFSTVL